MRFSPTMLALITATGLLSAAPHTPLYNEPQQTGQIPDANRLDWWRDARFGMFIHWGLYAVPAGEWGGRNTYGEWILNSARIPVNQYENFKDQFNPTKFDADAWVKMAADAGMKYIVITSKHHDGFALFDSKLTDWSVASTPFKRDILKELADACAKQGIRLGFYHSIMDWHHPDYLPRRSWESRPSSGADFSRYVAYMKGQLKELLTNYGPISVLWYDGQWENTWTHELGQDLYKYTRSLQPQILVNNRVDKGGSGSMHITTDSKFAGDFSVPEQEVPPSAIPGVDWETCMTMNDHWGYNKANQNWKSSTMLIRTLIDTASKGGNFLLNVGPMADGEFPQASVERLAEIGRWMKTNSESIYGAQASPFPRLAFGRCTQKDISKSATRLYFHVFDWPADATLSIPGLNNSVRSAYLLSDPGKRLKVSKAQGETKISLPATAPDAHATVIAVEISGRPDLALPPAIDAVTHIFHDALDVYITTGRQNVTLHYSLDGSEPTAQHPAVQQGRVSIDQTRTVKARAFRGQTAVGPIGEATFKKMPSKPSLKIELASGVNWEYFEGSFKTCDEMKTPADKGNSANFTLQPAKRRENFGLRFEGYIDIPATGIFTFFTTSSGGSCLWIDGEKVVDNDGPHGSETKGGDVSLERGLHAIRVDFFQAEGNAAELVVRWQGLNLPNEPVGDSRLKRRQ